MYEMQTEDNNDNDTNDTNDNTARLSVANRRLSVMQHPKIAEARASENLVRA